MDFETARTNSASTTETAPSITPEQIEALATVLESRPELTAELARIHTMISDYFAREAARENEPVRQAQEAHAREEQRVARDAELKAEVEKGIERFIADAKKLEATLGEMGFHS